MRSCPCSGAERLLRTQDCMRRAILICLFGETNALKSDALANLLRIVAHDRHNALRRGNVQRSTKNMVQQRISAGFVQDFGSARFHACSQPSGQDHDA